jgi:hypothetical protein
MTPTSIVVRVSGHAIEGSLKFVAFRRHLHQHAKAHRCVRGALANLVGEVAGRCLLRLLGRQKLLAGLRNDAVAIFVNDNPKPYRAQ